MLARELLPYLNLYRQTLELSDDTAAKVKKEKCNTCEEKINAANDTVQLLKLAIWLDDEANISQKEKNKNVVGTILGDKVGHRINAVVNFLGLRSPYSKLTMFFHAMRTLIIHKLSEDKTYQTIVNHKWDEYQKLDELGLEGTLLYSELQKQMDGILCTLAAYGHKRAIWELCKQERFEKLGLEPTLFTEYASGFNRNRPMCYQDRWYEECFVRFAHLQKKVSTDPQSPSNQIEQSMVSSTSQLLRDDLLASQVLDNNSDDLEAKLPPFTPKSQNGEEGMSDSISTTPSSKEFKDQVTKTPISSSTTNHLFSRLPPARGQQSPLVIDTNVQDPPHDDSAPNLNLTTSGEISAPPILTRTLTS